MTHMDYFQRDRTNAEIGKVALILFGAWLVFCSVKNSDCLFKERGIRRAVTAMERRNRPIEYLFEYLVAISDLFGRDLARIIWGLIGAAAIIKGLSDL